MRRLLGTAAVIGLWWLACNIETFPAWLANTILVIMIAGIITIARWVFGAHDGR